MATTLLHLATVAVPLLSLQWVMTSASAGWFVLTEKSAGYVAAVSASRSKNAGTTLLSFQCDGDRNLTLTVEPDLRLPQHPMICSAV